MKRQKSTLRLILEPLAIAIGLALLVRHSLFHIYAIPSASMAPTLQPGDRILVTPYHFFDAPPSRGDVIVFRSPSADELIVKRIIGTPGDLIESHLGRVMVGKHTLAERYVPDATASGSIAPQIVPANCYFVMGDNRGNSSDSRSWGPLPADLVVGRVRMVLWSSNGGSSEPSAKATTRNGDPSSAAPLATRRLFLPIE
jgi:signal peptidase I